MPVSFDIDVDDAKVRGFLNNIFDKIVDVKERRSAFIDSISAFVYQDVIKHFEQEQGPKGKWKSWSKSYSEIMQERGRGGNKILQDSGRMRNAFTPKKHKRVSEGVVWFNPAKTKKGFPYAYAHNEGGPKLPARTFMWLSKYALDKITLVTLKYVSGEKV